MKVIRRKEEMEGEYVHVIGVKREKKSNLKEGEIDEIWKVRVRSRRGEELRKARRRKTVDRDGGKTEQLEG